MLRDLIVITIQVFALVTALTAVVLSLVWLERKTLARLQRRMGPMVVGPHGLLQPVADALKLLVKEDIIPALADKPLFWLAPLVVFVPSFVIWVTIPFAQSFAVRNMELGLFFIVAFSVLSIVGVVMAGWGSANKYAVLGGLRSAAQLISYEIPIIMVVIAVIMLPHSMNLVTIVEGQRAIPYALLQPLGLVIFLLAGVAEVGRTPFDIYFAESEVMGGPFIEYSGAHWAVFFLAEYVNTFTIAVLAALLFLGGWAFPLMPEATWVGFLGVLVKAYLVVLVIFWFRGTFPRLRIDQLMSFGWKVLIPLSFVNFGLTAAYLFYGLSRWSLALASLFVTAAVAYTIYRRMTWPARATAEQRLAKARAYRRVETTDAR
ncbi:MAG: NADH-quinone oxidoreductase subunit NuoH [Chloroflexi bacterium]|nr:NADH-quinone oxidoreductase subunit NuoH [Chloroflexota bacterium]